MSRTKSAIQPSKSGKVAHLDSVTEFNPTQLMQELHKYCASKDFLGGMVKLCGEACNVSNSLASTYKPESLRVMWYHWRDDVPGFANWWNDQAHKHFASATPGVHGSMLRAAMSEDGTAADRKLWLEKFDERYQAKGESGGSAGTTVNINIEAEVMALLAAAADGGRGFVPGLVVNLPAALPVIEAEVEETGK